jgi:beta-1,4-mannosyltransferase
MNRHLRESWKITTPIYTLYDRPPSHFKPFNSEERSSFLRSQLATKNHVEKIMAGQTRLLLSSTSWTPDEDFRLLLSALLAYDRNASAENFLRPGTAPSILVVITGKGPLRDGYMERIETLEFQNVIVESVWLKSEDYPKMIACADLGVCLHTSSSGMDLPMKVVDLFGVGVPVAAVRYSSIGELVKHRENGVLFDKDEDLAAVLIELLDPKKHQLKTLKSGAMRETENTWDDNWDKVAAPVFDL